MQRVAQLAYAAAAAAAAAVMRSEFVGQDTSQPFAALKQQVNMRLGGSRVLATAVVIGAERQQSSCGLDAKRQQRAETTSQRASCEPLYVVA